MASFVGSLSVPRRVILLVKAGSAVDDTIAQLTEHLSAGDLIIDGGNEWYPNTERRAEELKGKGILYLGMGVSGGEEGARNGPSMMPGGALEGYKMVEHILLKVAAQTGGPCVTYIGPGGAGNYVKMVHNGIEYGDMQLIAEAYDVLKTIGGFTNAELADAFAEWNRGELESFLIEITAQIFATRDDQPGATGDLVDKILDKTGMKGTGRWTVQEAAERSVPAPTIAAALDGRYLSGLKDERVAASAVLEGPDTSGLPAVDKAQLLEDVRRALYASKICSYAQGMNIIRGAAAHFDWGLDLAAISRIWKGGCIIRARFLDRIATAYERDGALASLLVDTDFSAELKDRQASWRRIVSLAVAHGVPVPAFSNSLSYYDAYRRERLPANLVQAQRDFFGAHTFERTDMEGSFHAKWNGAD
jgi:6-phosphogluconate dehydrogenase